MDGMWKLFRILMFMGGLIVKVIIAIFSGPLNGMQLHIKKEHGNLLAIFARTIFICLIWTAPDKISSNHGNF